MTERRSEAVEDIELFNVFCYPLCGLRGLRALCAKIPQRIAMPEGWAKSRARFRAKVAKGAKAATGDIGNSKESVSIYFPIFHSSPLPYSITRP
ncbi:hypothetical protein DB346_11695 [Verrucomicrobia bacterium LW23]|nr:hypothetical protein DB346_11695 [Verrucomicrobia bacterium LW23]